MPYVSKPLHDVFVLHSIMRASVCVSFGRPWSYQQGYLKSAWLSCARRHSLSLSYISAAGSIARVEAVDVASDVTKGEIAKLHAGVVWSFSAAGVSLVDVCLAAVSRRSR
jgi:hypothetical protein